MDATHVLNDLLLRDIRAALSRREPSDGDHSPKMARVLDLQNLHNGARDLDLIDRCAAYSYKNGAHDTCLSILELATQLGLARRPHHQLRLLCHINSKRFGDAVAVADAHLTAGLPSSDSLAAFTPPVPSEPPPPRAPSAAMRSLTPLYQALHAEEQPEKSNFDGWLGLAAHAWIIRRLTAQFGLESVLDYGGGKGLGWSAGPITLADGSRYDRFLDYAGLGLVSVYDPGADADAAPPAAGGWDASFCLDVLEHVPEEDVDWVLMEIFASARKLVLLNIALYPAIKFFPDGRNVHITLRPPEWWIEKIKRACSYYPQVRAACYFSRAAAAIRTHWLR